MPTPSSLARPTAILALCAALTAPLQAQTTTPASGVTVTVVVSGHAPRGTLAGALYASAEGFPAKDGAAAQRTMLPASTASDTIVFRNVTPGRYAFAVYLDTNGNAKLDTNMLGIPKEAWGVSGNVRPSMRSPRFEEAAFDVRANTTIAVTVR